MLKRRPFLLLVSFGVLLSLLLLSQVLSNWSLFSRPGYASTIQSGHETPPSFTYQQYLKQAPKPKVVKSGPPSPYPQPPRQTTGGKPTTRPPDAEPPTMKALTQPLTSAFLAGSASALDLKGNDGRLEIQLQPGSLDMSHATVAGGAAPNGSLTLQVTQVHGHYEGLMNQLGYYQAQIIDSQGQVVNGIILRSPVTIIYHYQPTELAGLNLNPAHLLLDWPTLIAAAQQAKQPTTTLVIAMRDNPTARTLTALSPVFGPGPFSLFADPQNQGDPSPHVAEMQGNNGQLTYSYPLQVAPGTGGFAPQLALNYSSMDPNDRHSATSPAGDEGDGWSLGLGSITMETYPTTPTATNWYFINGVDNVSDRLIEYDTTNKLFYTEHLSYLRIQQVTTNGQSCFDVWDKSGTFYELGCTKDSLEYSVSGSTTYDYQWNVDRIVAPNQGPKASEYRMILATYLQDCSPASTSQPCPATDTVRDAVLQQITYGSATSVTASTLSSIAGTIDFTYHAPFSYTSNNVTWATAYGNNYNCASAPPDNQTTTLRCDDPIQRSGGFTPPDVMSTFSLDRITSYIGPDSGTGSYPAYAYTFSYTDTPFYGISCIDPILLTDGYCAGEHTLSSITPHIYLQGTDHARKSISFSYATSINSYYDSLDQVRSGNPPTYFQNSTLWNYLTSYFDLNTGIGESISYETAYSNTDGTPTIKVNGSVADDRFDALYCTSNAGNSNQSLQCFQGSWLHPNDQAWSVQVVTSITSSGKDDSALSQATTTYAYYRLADTGTYSGSGAWCYPDQYTQENQCVGDNWFASFDGDWGDYYHAEFRGFAQVSVKTPAGDLVNSYYFSTEGWDKSPTDPGDYDAGQVQVQEIYQGGSQNAANLLSETVNTYPGPYAQNGDSKKNPNNDATACYTPNGPSSYAACDVVILSSATTDYEGQSSGPSVTTSYTYDDYTPSGGLTTCKVRITFCAYHNLFQKQVSTSNSNVPTVTDTWSYSPNDQNAGGWTYYTVDAATHSETDSGGHIYQCQDITYDEGGPSGLTVPVAGWPTTVSTYSNANCVTPRGAAISTTYTGYDAYGNPVATVDGVATAPGNSSIYSTNGCTLSTNPYVMSAAWTTNYSRYTSCVTYDSPYNAQPATTANAFGQSETTTFDYTQAALPTQVKDANSQQTSTSYSIDGNGNETVQTQLPLHSSSYTTESITNSNCASGDTLPCYEVDTISNQYNTVTARTFYDSQGRAVETRTPGPTSGYDTVVFTTYDDVGHSMFQSLPFVVSDGSSFIDPATVNPGGTATFYDALGRVLATKDPNLGQTQQPDPEPGQNCPAPLSATATDCTTYSLGTVSDSNDSNTYLIVTAIDPNGHATVNALDPLGRTAYVQFDSGTFSGTFSLNELKAITYNFLNEPTAITVTDEKTQSGQHITSVTNTTASYDDLGRLTGITDPDRGTHAYTYDADGQMLTDVSGTRTIGYVYDLLGRVGCVQNMTPTESATGACSSGATQYVKNTYDTSNLGTQGTNDFPVGLLTKSVATTRYPDNSNAQVSETYQHDQRGRLVAEQISFPNLPSAWNVTTSLPKYKVQYTYNDADQLTTTTTTTNPVGQGYTTTQVYDPTTGTQTGLSDNGTNTPDLATLSFNTQAQISSLNYLTSGGGSALATDQFSYDGDLRPITDTANWQSGSGNGTAAIFSQSRSFDPAGNLTSLTTTQAGIPTSMDQAARKPPTSVTTNKTAWSGRATPESSHYRVMVPAALARSPVA